MFPFHTILLTSFLCNTDNEHNLGLYLASKSVSMHRDFVNTHLLLWATNTLEVLVKKIYFGNVKGIENTSLNEARKRRFTQATSSDLKKIAPNFDALNMHSLRVAHSAGLEKVESLHNVSIPVPVGCVLNDRNIKEFFTYPNFPNMKSLNYRSRFSFIKFLYGLPRTYTKYTEITTIQYPTFLFTNFLLYYLATFFNMWTELCDIY